MIRLLIKFLRAARASEPSKRHRRGSVDNFPSLELIYEVIRESRNEQNARISTLDTKAGFTLAAASVLTGGVGTLTAGFAGYSGNRTHQADALDFWVIDMSLRTATISVTVAILVAYAGVILCTFRAYQLRSFALVPDPMKLRNKYVEKPPRETLEVLVTEITDSIACNEKQVDRKTVWVGRAIFAIGLEAVLAVLVGSLQIWMV